MTKLEFISIYLKYLLKWNTSASLKSILQEVEIEISQCEDGYYSDYIDELIHIVQCEYEDTCKMTKSHIMSMEDMLTMINRDKTINQILYDK